MKEKKHYNGDNADDDTDYRDNFDGDYIEDDDVHKTKDYCEYKG